jgi:hypothetical protein
MVVQIDKGVLTEADYENFKDITLDDGSIETVYISRAGNIVTPPKERRQIDINRQQLCWDLYIKGLRAGNPSAIQAAKDAGFAPNSALNVTNQHWWKERKKILGRKSIAGKAERNLSRGLDVQWSKMKLLENGEEEEVIDKDLFREVMGVSKFIAGTLLKDEGYSTKTEVVGKMEGEIKINSISYADQPLEITSELENKVVDDSIKMVEGEILKEINKEQNATN